LIKNTSYSGRSDYDLSNCTIDSNLNLINCIYLISGRYIPPPINTTNTTAQIKPYSKFCIVNFSEIGEAVANIGTFTQNCTSSID
jgi:hypothetical protein